MTIKIEQPTERREKEEREMNLREGIGIRQQMIMQCIWQSENPPTVLEIIDMLEERCGQRLATSTITTLCQGLSKRGYIHQGPLLGP